VFKLSKKLNVTISLSLRELMTISRALAVYAFITENVNEVNVANSAMSKILNGIKELRKQLEKEVKK